MCITYKYAKIHELLHIKSTLPRLRFVIRPMSPFARSRNPFSINPYSSGLKIACNHVKLNYQNNGLLKKNSVKAN